MLIDIVNQQVRTNKVSLIIVNDKVSPNLLHAIDEKVDIVLIKRPEGSKNPYYIAKINYILWKQKPDIVHCHNHNMIKLLHLNLKYFLTIHAIGVPTVNFKHFDKLFAISHAVKKDVENRSRFSPCVIENGINLDHVESKTNYTFDTFRIIQVSRLAHKDKGQDILLEALRKIIQKRNQINISVDFVGEGSSEQYLKSLVKEYNLENRVNFLGTKDRKWIYQNLKNYDLLIQPSVFEGFGLTIPEAMAAKLPLLVSDIDAIMEIIENGKFGNYFRSEDSDHCAEMISNIIDNYNEQEIIANKAYRHSRKYSVKTTVENYLKNYV